MDPRKQLLLLVFWWGFWSWLSHSGFSTTIFQHILWWRSLSGPAKTKTPTSLLVVVAVFGDPSILHGGFSYHQWISCSPFVGCLVVVFVILILLFDSDVYVLRCSAVLLSWCPHTRARIPFLPPPCSAVVVLAATHFYSPQYRFPFFIFFHAYFIIGISEV